MAKVAAISYKTLGERPLTFSRFITKFFGRALLYNRELSTDLYCHYENDKTIVVAVRGMKKPFSDFKDFVDVAYSHFSNNELREERDTMFYLKLKDLKNTTKKIYLVGHSLGAWTIAVCLKKYHVRIDTIFFAAFAPNTNLLLSNTFAKLKNYLFGYNEVQKWFVQQNWIRKFYFIQDMAANGAVDIPFKRHVIEYDEPYSNMMNLTVYGHSLDTWISLLNNSSWLHGFLF